MLSGWRRCLLLFRKLYCRCLTFSVTHIPVCPEPSSCSCQCELTPLEDERTFECRAPISHSAARRRVHAPCLIGMATALTISGTKASCTTGARIKRAEEGGCLHFRAPFSVSLLLNDRPIFLGLALSLLWLKRTQTPGRAPRSIRQHTHETSQNSLVNMLLRPSGG